MRERARWLFSLGLAILGGAIGLASVALAQANSPATVVSSEPNYQGLWWNAPPESESGWGINLAHQGDVIFATWFTYDSTGDVWWLSMTASRTAEGTYAGTLIETTGPAFNALPFDPARVNRVAVGTGTLTFRGVDTGVLSYTINNTSQSKFITRQAFGPLPTCTYAAQPNLVGATNYQDLWWVASGAESGWGVNLTHQGDTIFVTWFTYDLDGSPLWLSSTAQKTGPATFSGQLIRTRGPAFNADPFDPARVTRTVVGTATLAFTNGNSATFAYTVDGVTQTKSITRQLFAPPAGTVCGEPYRSLTSTTIVAAGDIGQCPGAAAASAAARTAALVTPDDTLVLTLGDHAYDDGTPAQYANCFDPTWGSFKDRIRPSPGNHDYATPGAAGYFGYFGAQAGPDHRGYYSFDHGGWHFISLDSLIDVSARSDQYLWLKSDLANSATSLCTLAYWHFPMFNSGATYGGNPEMKPFFDALYAAGVELVLSGHEHIYERFAPQEANGTVDPARGVRQFVIGTGGHELSEFGPPLPNSAFRYNANWGIGRLTLGQGSYRWQFVPVGGGAPMDSGAANCHR